MKDGQRVIRNGTLGEYLLIPFASFFRFREVVRKVGTDQLLALDAGDLDGRLVDVGDFALGADGHQRVETGFDQAAGVERSGAQSLVRAGALRNVSGNRRNTDPLALRVVNWRGRQRERNGLPVLAQTDGFIVFDTLAGADSGKDSLRSEERRVG